MNEKKAAACSCSKSKDKGKAKPKFKWTKRSAVQAMTMYLDHLGRQRPLGQKMAGVCQINALAAALNEHQDINKALAETYPEKTAADRTKLAADLAHGLNRFVETKLAAMGSMPGALNKGAGGRAMQGQTTAPGLGNAKPTQVTSPTTATQAVSMVPGSGSTKTAAGLAGLAGSPMSQQVLQNAPKPGIMDMAPGMKRPQPAPVSPAAFSKAMQSPMSQQVLQNAPKPGIMDMAPGMKRPGRAVAGP